MIYDCFCFFNELDLLEIRLNTLDSVVDKFVLVEACKTQSLLDKPFYFEENKSRYEKFLDKIIHVKVFDCPSNQRDTWSMENHQRNCIARGLITAADKDLIMISDLDEIPHPQKIQRILSIHKNGELIHPLAFNQKFYAYFLNLNSDSGWIGTVITPYSLLQQYCPQTFRTYKDNLQSVANGGWHFSWLGGAEMAWKKAVSCIEPIDKSHLPSKEEFIKFFADYKNNQEHFFVRTEDLTSNGKKLFKCPIDETYPDFIVNNQERFKHFIL